MLLPAEIEKPPQYSTYVTRFITLLRLSNKNKGKEIYTNVLNSGIL